MRLWSIQPRIVFDALQRDGEFVCSPEKSELLKADEFKTAYDWLVLEMEKRIGSKPQGVEYPIWAWHTRNFKHKKPDLRESAYVKRGLDAACIEIEVPDSEVLLSDFDTWHFVLNDSYIDDSKNEQEWEKNQDWFDSLPEKLQREEKLRSWQRVFDISPMDTEWEVRGKYIQAVFWKLKMEQVKDVRFFKGR